MIRDAAGIVFETEVEDRQHDADDARVARETLDYLLREMHDADGGFHAAQDADSEGEEGRFYVWTPAQLVEVLGEEGRRVEPAALRKRFERAVRQWE